MSHIYLLSSRLHAAKGYESIGQDSGPHRAGVRLIFHSSDGQTVEATDLAVAFMKRDGDRSALYMREIRVSGLFPTSPRRPICSARSVMHRSRMAASRMTSCASSASWPSRRNAARLRPGCPLTCSRR